MRCMVTLFENETMERALRSLTTRIFNFLHRTYFKFTFYKDSQVNLSCDETTGIENGQVINRFILTVVQLVLISLVLSTSARIPLLHLRELITPIGICLQEYCLLRNWG